MISLPKLYHIVAVTWVVESSCDPSDSCTSAKRLTASTAKLRLEQVTGMAREALWRRSPVSRKCIKEAILLIVKPASLKAQQAVGTRSYATRRSAGVWLSVSRPRSDMRLLALWGNLRCDKSTWWRVAAGMQSGEISPGVFFSPFAVAHIVKT